MLLFKSKNGKKNRVNPAKYRRVYGLNVQAAAKLYIKKSWKEILRYVLNATIILG